MDVCRVETRQLYVGVSELEFANFSVKSGRNNKILLSLFPRYIAKCHQIYNLDG